MRHIDRLTNYLNMPEQEGESPSSVRALVIGLDAVIQTAWPHGLLPE